MCVCVLQDDNLVATKISRNKAFGFRPVLSMSFGGQHMLMVAGEENESLKAAPKDGAARHPTVSP